jgi:hypothetical protein
MGVAGGEVMECIVEVASLQPQMAPGVAHVEVELVNVDDAEDEDVVGSLHPPKNPGCSQVVVVAVGVGVMAGVVVAVGMREELLVVVTSSLHPNQPGVLHVDVEVVVTLLVDVCDVAVVVSSRQPHHPGVLQVAVLVRVFVEVEDVDVVLSVPLLS